MHEAETKKMTISNEVILSNINDEINKIISNIQNLQELNAGEKARYEVTPLTGFLRNINARNTEIANLELQLSSLESQKSTLEKQITFDRTKQRPNQMEVFNEGTITPPRITSPGITIDPKLVLIGAGVLLLL